MNEILQGLAAGARLVVSLDGDLFEIVGRSLEVTLTAVAIASLIGLPIGAWLAVNRFRWRRHAIAVLNSLMGLPPVVVGLMVYLMLSRAGPFGVLDLLFTPISLNTTRRQRMMALLWDGRRALLTAALAGFGRGIGEVGAIMIVGGNIDHVTRVLTTAIALETGRGDFAMALGLGFVLIVLAILINLLIHTLSQTERSSVW